VPNDILKNSPNLPLSNSIPTVSILRQDWLTAPVAASTTAYLSAGVAGPNTTTSTVGRASFDGALGTAGAPDYARNVVVTVTHATSVVALSGIISGVDVYGRPITETWSVTATGTTKTYTGAKAFGRVDSITITAAADASADTVKLGTGAVLGLKYPCVVSKLLAEIDSGSIVTNGTIVGGAGQGTAAQDARGTYAPNGAPNGTKTYSIWYMSDVPTDI
jgi:hypothetical protein